MKCHKCEKEIDSVSRFCSNCGTELKEKPNHVMFEDLVKTASKVWFVLGFVKGCDKYSLNEFEKVLKNNHEDLWELYEEVIEHWKNWAKEGNNEKDKKTNGSE